MSEWWLVGLLFLFSVLASLVLVYPLRRNALLCVCLMMVIAVFGASGYACWGGFFQWRQYIVQNKSHVLAQKMLHSIKSPQELIQKLRAKLDNSSKSAKGWYLLGRLYLSQNEGQNAQRAFYKAYTLQADEVQYGVHYAYSLWENNRKRFTPEIRKILTQLLNKNPNQPDALAMLAMDSFEQHDYKMAISYWEQLLKLTPPRSEEAQAIRKAIARAQARI
jgi:cytochrome c-type biogenesis protein CcmH